MGFIVLFSIKFRKKNRTAKYNTIFSYNFSSLNGKQQDLFVPQRTLYPPSSWLSFAVVTCFSVEVSVPDFLVAIRLRILNLFTEADVSMSTAVEVAAADESETAVVSCCNLLPVGRLSLLRIAVNNNFKFKKS